MRLGEFAECMHGWTNARISQTQVFCGDPPGLASILSDDSNLENQVKSPALLRTKDGAFGSTCHAQRTSSPLWTTPSSLHHLQLLPAIAVAGLGPREEFIFDSRRSPALRPSPQSTSKAPPFKTRRAGHPTSNPGTPVRCACRGRPFKVRLSYHANESFHQGASRFAQPDPAQARSPAGRFPRRRTRRGEDHPDPSASAAWKRPNRQRSRHRFACLDVGGGCGQADE